MNVLVVARGGWPFPSPPGGADAIALRQSIALGARGLGVVLVGQGKLPEGGSDVNVKLVQSGIGKSLESRSQAGYYFKVLAFSIVASVRAVSILRRQEAFDVVHCHHSVIATILRVLGPRQALVLTVHDNPFGKADRASPLLERSVRILNNLLLEKLGVSLADGIIAVSPEVHARLSAWGVPAGKIVEIWPSAPDRSRDGCEASTPGDETDTEAPDHFVLSVGDLTGRKRMDLLVRSLADIPSDVHLVIVGRGPGRKSLERLIAELGLGRRVRIHEYVSDTKLRALQRQALAAVLVSEREGLPTSLIEAVSVGTPALYATTRPVSVPDTEPYLHHVQAESPPEIARELRRLLDSGAGTGAPRARIREWAAQKFPAGEAVADALVGVYRSVCQVATVP